MKTIYYDKTVIGTTDKINKDALVDAAGKTLDEIIYEYCDRMLTAKDMCGRDKDELLEMLLEDLMKGGYTMNGHVTIGKKDLEEEAEVSAKEAMEALGKLKDKFFKALDEFADAQQAKAHSENCEDCGCCARDDCEDDDEDDVDHDDYYDDEDEYYDDDAPVTIGYHTERGIGTLNMTPLEKKMAAQCGCPVCDGKLVVFGKLERMGRMPTLYASICQGCGAHICFGSDEQVFFPLKDEE